MATKRMLVDATHPEETRIVVTSGNKLEEFDFESASHRQLRGNIYLAKVTRVEPSLQAAFVEYGGNRHGFLAFSEIHPDYYQIPIADREALLAAEAEANARSAAASAEAEIKQEAEDANDSPSDEPIQDLGGEDAVSADDEISETSGDSQDGDQDGEQVGDQDTDDDNNEDSDANAKPPVDDLGGGEGEDMQATRRVRAKRYKIQEVVKRRQVMLVQVVKEERGNKGAALTTYLSLAGRYSVLMPNTARGGGISRKITSASDRKRLKAIASELDVPTGMGVILRTAGAARTKAEVRRDFEYLSRLWENVRQLTMQSTAPCLVYAEGSLIKRTIRDLYDKDISEIVVAGEEGFQEAKEFMKLIMPTHAKNVNAYTEDHQIFTRYNVEAQLDSMFSPQVTLPSGGYIVINPTEALVSIDVNSGRATKEHNIEDTALQTNLESADEVARQLRLRDMAGLIVIDFIDMMERRSIRAVEKRLKDALKNDRARIQIGRISHFGLMEMSRQRMRFGVLESSTHTCPTCQGAGIVRSVESVALMVMRAIEDQVARRSDSNIEVKVPVDVALYLLNSKRTVLSGLESANGLTITIGADNLLVGSQFSINKGEPRQGAIRDDRNANRNDAPRAIAAPASEETSEERPQRKRRRRRRSGQSDEDNAVVAAETPTTDDAPTTEAAPGAETENGAETDEEQPRKRRRRGRRGGRRNKRLPNEENGVTAEGEASEASGSEPNGENAEGQAGAAESQEGSEGAVNEAQPEEAVAAQDQTGSTESTPDAEKSDGAKKPARRRTRRKKTPQTDADLSTADQPAVVGPEAEQSPSGPEVPASDPVAETKPAKKPASRRGKAKKEPEAAQSAAPAQASESSDQADGAANSPKAKKELPAEGVIVTSSSNEETAEKPKKGGWWARRLGL